MGLIGNLREAKHLANGERRRKTIASEEAYLKHLKEVNAREQADARRRKVISVYERKIDRARSTKKPSRVVKVIKVAGKVGNYLGKVAEANYNQSNKRSTPRKVKRVKVVRKKRSQDPFNFNFGGF